MKRRGSYGWVILAVAGLGIFVSGPGQSHTFSVFLVHIQADLGLSATSISSAYAVATLAAAFGLPWMGRLVDRWGPRRMLLAVTVLLGLACMALIQRKFVVIHKAQGSGIAEEAIKRIATLYGIEKEVRGQPPDKRVKARQRKSKPISNDLEAWLHAQLTRISGKSPLARAIRYALTRMKKLRPWLEYGFLELDNNTAERSKRPIALGRKNYLFMGSGGGGKSAAIAYTLIETAKLNRVDPQAWLTNVLGRIADHKITKLDELLPWRYAEVSA